MKAITLVCLLSVLLSGCAKNVADMTDSEICYAVGLSGAQGERSVVIRGTREMQRREASGASVISAQECKDRLQEGQIEGYEREEARVRGMIWQKTFEDLQKVDLSGL